MDKKNLAYITEILPAKSKCFVATHGISDIQTITRYDIEWLDSIEDNLSLLFIETPEINPLSLERYVKSGGWIGGCVPCPYTKGVINLNDGVWLKQIEKGDGHIPLKYKIDNDCIFVMAMRRSGHHSIMNWMFGLANYGIEHFNNAEIQGDKFCIWKGKNRSNYNLHQNRKSEGLKKVINIEDKSMAELQALPSKNLKILIIRDGYNNFSSRIKNDPDLKYHKTLDVGMWMDYAEEFYNPSKLQNCYGINYNQWFVDKQYRSKVANDLFGNFTVDLINYIPVWHSLFEGGVKQGNAQTLNVLNRWKDMKSNKYFKSLIAQKRFQELNDVLFDFNPQIKIL